MANRQTKVSSTKKATKAKIGSSFHSKPAKKTSKNQKWKVVNRNSACSRIVNTETGTTKFLLTPHGKAKKFAMELSSGEKYTNERKPKGQALTNTEAAWRSGYLAAQSDSAKAFRAKHPNYTRKTR